MLPVGNVIRISRLIFPAFPTGAIESSMYTNDCLAVSSVRIKFPFVPLLYEVIPATESDISLPLRPRSFFCFVLFSVLCRFFKICPSQVCRSSWVEWTVYKRGRFRAQGQGYRII